MSPYSRRAKLVVKQTLLRMTSVFYKLYWDIGSSVYTRLLLFTMYIDVRRHRLPLCLAGLLARNLYFRSAWPLRSAGVGLGLPSGVLLLPPFLWYVGSAAELGVNDAERSLSVNKATPFSSFYVKPLPCLYTSLRPRVGTWFERNRHRHSGYLRCK